MTVDVTVKTVEPPPTAVVAAHSIPPVVLSRQRFRAGHFWDLGRRGLLGNQHSGSPARAGIAYRTERAAAD
jgi:hypothetical protein